MKIVKRLSLFCFGVMVCFSAFFISGCSWEEVPIMESGDFRYCYINGTNSSVRVKDGENVAILELTATGKQKDTIIIPDYIDDKPVVQIGMEGLGWGYGIGGKGSICKKLYLPKFIGCIIDKDVHGPNKKVFIKELSDLSFLNNEVGNYISEQVRNQYRLEYGTDSPSGYKLRVANISYFSDEEIYIIDDSLDGVSITPPPVPVRAGYIFDGWYTDTDFTVQWDFVDDTFYTSMATPTMTLYAKWVEV